MSVFNICQNQHSDPFSRLYRPSEKSIGPRCDGCWSTRHLPAAGGACQHLAANHSDLLVEGHDAIRPLTTILGRRSATDDVVAERGVLVREIVKYMSSTGPCARHRPCPTRPIQNQQRRPKLYSILWSNLHQTEQHTCAAAMSMWLITDCPLLVDMSTARFSCIPRFRILGTAVMTYD